MVRHCCKQTDTTNISTSRVSQLCSIGFESPQSIDNLANTARNSRICVVCSQHNCCRQLELCGLNHGMDASCLRPLECYCEGQQAQHAYLSSCLLCCLLCCLVCCTLSINFSLVLTELCRRAKIVVDNTILGKQQAKSSTFIDVSPAAGTLFVFVFV